jgi:hypothetical protein
MNSTDLQPSPFSGHLIPGLAYVLFGFVLFPMYAMKSCLGLLNARKLVGITGFVLMVVAIVCMILLFVDIFANNDTSTKFHRVLSMSVFPLGVTMFYHWASNEKLPKQKSELKTSSLLNEKEKEEKEKEKEESYLWKLFMPIYCFMSAIMYAGHQHHEEGETGGEMSMMPSPEEQAHIPLFMTFLAAGLFYTLAFIITQHKRFLQYCGNVCIIIIGIWYTVIAVVLYAGFFGAFGVNYGDASGDFAIVMVVTSSFFVFAYIVFVLDK